MGMRPKPWTKPPSYTIAYRWDDFARSLSLVYTEGVSHARAGRE
jgi:hypothetical protein